MISNIFIVLANFKCWLLVLFIKDEIFLCHLWPLKIFIFKLRVIVEDVALNKFGLLLNNILHYTRTLELFKTIIKTEIIYKSYQNAKLEGLGEKT